MPHALRVLWALLRQPTPRAAQPMQFRLQLWALTALVLLLASLDSPGGLFSWAPAAQQDEGLVSWAPAAQQRVPPGHAAREHFGSLDGWSLARSGRVYTPLSLSPLLVYTRVVGQQLSVRVNGVAAAGAAELTGRMQPLRLCPPLELQPCALAAQPAPAPTPLPRRTHPLQACCTRSTCSRAGTATATARRCCTRAAPRTSSRPRACACLGRCRCSRSSPAHSSSATRLGLGLGLGSGLGLGLKLGPGFHNILDSDIDSVRKVRVRVRVRVRVS